MSELGQNEGQEQDKNTPFFDSSKISDKKDVEQAYYKGDWGYFIETNEKDHFSAYYFVEDTVVEVSSFDEEGVKQLKELLKSFGYPC